MNSFNHYAYGAIGEWLYRVVAGIEIDPQAPGYKHIIIQPHTGGGLSFAKASHQSLYGPVASGWELKDKQLLVTVEIPANSSATVKLPQARLENVLESGQPVASVKGVIRSSQNGQTAVVEVGSGRYEFSYPMEQSGKN
jgi:alpha-L-rhamnosidase